MDKFLVDYSFYVLCTVNQPPAHSEIPNCSGLMVNATSVFTSQAVIRKSTFQD